MLGPSLTWVLSRGRASLYLLPLFVILTELKIKRNLAASRGEAEER